MIWMNGWGIGAERLRGILARAGIAGENIAVIDPNPNWEEELEAALSTGGALCGYSTGAFLLLSRRDLWERASRVALFAPFADFRAESELGGRTREAQLKRLVRWLKADPLAALRDFYVRAGLEFDAPADLPQPAAELVWGIERLLEGLGNRVSLVGCDSFVGGADALLDAGRLSEMYSTIRVVEGAGHGLDGLLNEAEFLRNEI